MVLECPTCSLPIKSWGQHRRQQPHCARPSAIQSPHLAPRSLCANKFDVVSDERRQRLSDILSEFRHEKFWSNADVGQLKAAFPDMCNAALVGAFNVLRPLLRSDVTSDEVDSALDGLHCAAFSGIETRELEMKYIKADMPYLEPRVISLRAGSSAHVDQVVSFSLVDLLVRDLQNDPFVRHHVLKKSDEWKDGKHWCAPPADLCTSATAVPHYRAR